MAAPATANETQKKLTATRIKLGAWVLLLILVLIFVIQNSPPVKLTFFVWNFYFSLAVLIFIVLLVGMLLGWILSAIVRRRGRDRSASI